MGQIHTLTSWLKTPAGPKTFLPDFVQTRRETMPTFRPNSGMSVFSYFCLKTFLTDFLQARRETLPTFRPTSDISVFFFEKFFSKSFFDMKKIIFFDDFFSKPFSWSRRIHLKRFQSDSGSLKIRKRAHKISVQKKSWFWYH